MLLDFQRLHLRCTKERCPVGLAVSLAAVDKHRLKQGLCAVLYHVPGGLPACPSVHRLGDPGGLLGFLDALGVDRGSLCAVSCPVQGFGKAAHALAVQLPRLVHDLGEIVLLHTVLALLCGSAPV